MKYIYLVASIVLFTACNGMRRGSGNIITETRNTGVFSEVKASSSVEVDVQQGNETSVVVEADDNVIKFIETVVENGVLKIKLKNNFGLSNATTKVHVTSPVYSGFSTSSSSSITSKTTISNSTKITLTASSSSNIEVVLDAPSVEIDASSSADITASGKAKNVKIDASSSSKIIASDLKAEIVEADANSSSDIRLFASVSLKAKASSSADIFYTGGVTIVDKSENSSGTVTKQ
jgi:hypothetical protein